MKTKANLNHVQMRDRVRGQVTDFPKRATLMQRDFVRIGKGSMGGKARGSAFVCPPHRKHL